MVVPCFQCSWASGRRVIPCAPGVYGSQLHPGPTGGTLRYDAIAHISFANRQLGCLYGYGVVERALYKNFPFPRAPALFASTEG